MASAQHQNGLALGTTVARGSSFDKLPVELISEIVSHLAPDGLVSFASTQRFLNEVCQDALDEHQFRLDYYANVYIGERDEAGTHAIGTSALWYRHPMFLLSMILKRPAIANYIRCIVWNHKSIMEELESFRFRQHLGSKPTEQELMDGCARDIMLDIHNGFVDLVDQLPIMQADADFRAACLERVKLEDPHYCLWLVLVLTKNLEHLRMLKEVATDKWIELARIHDPELFKKLRNVELWERTYEYKAPARRFQNWLMLPNLERLSGDRLTQGWDDPAIESPLTTAPLTCLEMTSSEVEGASVAKILQGLDQLQSFSYVMYDENIMDSSTWDVSVVVKTLIKYAKRTLTKLVLRLDVPAPRTPCPELCELEALKHFVGPASLISHSYAKDDKVLTIDLKPSFASTLEELDLTTTHVWHLTPKAYMGGNVMEPKLIKISNAHCFPGLRQIRFSDADLDTSNVKALESLGIKFTASNPARDRVGGEIRYFEDSEEEEEDAFDYLVPSRVPEYFMKDGDSDEDEEASSGNDSDDEKSWETMSES